MINTSDSFKKEVYAPTRSVTAKIRFEFLDLTAFEDNTKSATSQEVFSNLDQVTNKVRSKTVKFATFEQDYLKLDGSYIIPPYTLDIDYEVGWISSTVSDSEGVFTPNQVLQFTFNNDHSSGGLTLYFDVLGNECASDFSIDVFDSSGNTLVHEDITDNTDSTYIFLTQLSNYRKVTITIQKWCKPYRRTKMVEVDFGVINEYQDDNLINFQLVQELDTTSNTLPADELTFTVDNSNRDFNILNPNGYYQFLVQGQEVYLEMGVLNTDSGEFEFIQVGKFFLKDWQSNEGTMTTTFTARDILDSLSNTEVENTTANNTTLYDLAVNVLTASNIENYVISDNLKSINTSGLYNSTSYRNLLQMIAVAGMCVAYSDNEGTFMIEQLISANAVIDSVSVSDIESLTSNNQIIDKVISPYGNVATFEKERFKLDGSFIISSEDMSQYELGWWSHLQCDDVGNFATPITIEIDLSKEHTSTNFQVIFDTLTNEYASELDIVVYDASGNVVINESATNSNSIFVYQNSLLADCRKVQLVLNKWSTGNRRARILEFGFDIPVDTLTFDNMYSEPQISLISNVQTIQVTYYPTNLDNSVTYTLNNPVVSDGITIQLDNSLIITEQEAINVANWILNENTNVATYTVDWRQNPALTLADKVAIQNGYGTNNIAHITKQELDYEGYLQGTTEAVGGY